MRLVRGAVLAVVLLVASVAAPPPAAAQASTGEPVTTMRLHVQADGDGRWTVTTEIPIEGADDRAAFEELREAFLDGEAGLSVDAFRNAAAAASTATGREMNVTRVSRSARVVDPANTTGNVSMGVLELSFTWTDFATVHNDTVVVGDAFNTTGGTWLPALTENQRLVIEPPRGYGVDDAPLATDPDSLDDGVLTWTGPQEFEPGDLTITYVRGTDEEGSFWERLELPGSVLPVGLTGAGLVAILLAAVLANRYRDRGAPDEDATGDDELAVEAGVGDTGEEPADEPPDEEPAPEGGEEEIDPELLSDEERVRHLLEHNGGRMKQANIVDETGWSNAKVSQLLSGMAEEGDVEKLRIGRENLISLPGLEPGVTPDADGEDDDSAG